MQIVIDATSGTYQNMLTTAPFVAIGKMYSCSVENDKGMSNTANLSGNCCNCSKSVIYCCTESFILCKWRVQKLHFQICNHFELAPIIISYVANIEFCTEP